MIVKRSVWLQIRKNVTCHRNLLADFTSDLWPNGSTHRFVLKRLLIELAKSYLMMYNYIKFPRKLSQIFWIKVGPKSAWSSRCSLYWTMMKLMRSDVRWLPKPLRNPVHLNAVKCRKKNQWNKFRIFAKCCSDFYFRTVIRLIYGPINSSANIVAIIFFKDRFMPSFYYPLEGAKTNVWGLTIFFPIKSQNLIENLQEGAYEKRP